ncbi:hypothetical protein [Serratia microhaemolytica]|uniref:hypothetical protein n=1 Tax=Serratia microhaemolytica TaxID=2675110 RepID=UPI000FDD330D|nr:hypothetical protein [Serratia microhaemolytica]
MFSFFGASFIAVCALAYKEKDIYCKFIRNQIWVFGYCLFGASAGSLVTLNIFHGYIINIKELIQENRTIEDYYNTGFSFLIIMLVLSIAMLVTLHIIDKIIFSKNKNVSNVKNDDGGS